MVSTSAHPGAVLHQVASGSHIPPNKVLQNATLNISDIRKTALVMKDGVLYRPDELYSALGVAP